MAGMACTADFSLSPYAGEVRGQVEAALSGYTDLGEGCPATCGRPCGTACWPRASGCGRCWRCWRRRPAAAAARGGHAGGLRGGNGPRLLADPRRPAGDGRRRSAAWPAHVPQGVRRGAGHSGRRRPVGAGVRGAGRRHPARRAAAACCRVWPRPPGRAMVGGQADDVCGRRPARTAGSAVLESIHRRKTGAMIRVRCDWARWSPGPASRSRPRWTAMAAAWAWPSRSPTTCSTSRRREQSWASGWARTPAGKLTFPGLLGIDESSAAPSNWSTRPAAALAPLGLARRGLGGPGPVRPGKESLMDKLACRRSTRPHDLKTLSHKQLEQLAGEMREALCRLVGTARPISPRTWAWSS